LKRGYFFVLALVAAVLVISCKKQIEVNSPFTAVNYSNAFNSDANAISLITSIYSEQAEGSIFSFSSGLNSISVKAGLSADELRGTSTSLGFILSKFYKNALTNFNTLTFWEIFYKNQYRINLTLEGLQSSTALSSNVKKQLVGECKFMRAFINFYLVNFYGDVPLITSSNYKVNATLARTPQVQVYQQIISDLKEAKDSLSDMYLDGMLSGQTSERIRPTKWAAEALLARVYLFTNDYVNADNEASNIISNKSLYDTVPLNSVFLKNSNEAIWQLQPVTVNQNTKDGAVFILTSAPNSFATPIYLTTFLLNSFEVGDARRTNWVGSVKSGATTYYYPYKYKVKTSASLTEYLMVLRLAEQFLIRAEARVKKSNPDIPGAISDINIIRNRAGLPNYAGATDVASLQGAILHERQVELFTEWGHRWLNLKRTNNVDSVMSIITPLKGGTWNTNWQWYPVPIYDLQTNPSLTQAAGY
jgi:hypothetical protein